MNTQYISLSSSTSTRTAYSNSFGNSTLCWYLFESNSNLIKSIKVSITSMAYSTAEVYLETSKNVFSSQGSISTGGSKNITIDTYNSVWVLVMPQFSSSISYVSVAGTASPYSSTSTSTSSSSSSSLHINGTLDLVWSLILFFLV